KHGIFQRLLATKVDLRRSLIPLKTRWNQFPQPSRRLVTNWENRSASRSTQQPPNSTTARKTFTFSKNRVAQKRPQKNWSIITLTFARGFRSFRSKTVARKTIGTAGNN